MMANKKATEKEYEFYRNGTVHGTVNAKNIKEARSKLWNAFGRKLEVHPK